MADENLNRDKKDTPVPADASENENQNVAGDIPEVPAVSDSTEGPKKKEKVYPMKAVNDLFDVLELFAICASVILLLFSFIIRPSVVQGPSMQDTLHQGDYLLVQEIGYTPRQGDIVVVQNVALTYYKEPIVKRVIATGGQEVNIDFDTWTVTVDGVELEEPYRKLTTDQRVTSDWTYPLTVPEGYIFVMGDNRNHSADSRSREIGLIDERCVVGRALFRILPFSRLGVLN